MHVCSTETPHDIPPVATESDPSVVDIESLRLVCQDLSNRTLRQETLGASGICINELNFISQISTMRQRLNILSQINSTNTNCVDFGFSGDLTFTPQPTSSSSGLYKSFLCGLLSGAEDAPPELYVWLEFQFRWVVWSFACLERRYPLIYLNTLLTRTNVRDLLAYRYLSYTSDTPRMRELLASRSADSFVPPLPRLTTFYRKDPRPSPRRGAKRFSITASMSPLQRCNDINTLVWSLCLCVSVNSSDGSVLVSDGWWYTQATLDPDLSRLVKKGTIRDGTKIVVFSAGFEQQGESNRMVLRYNCVRKATDSTKLGFLEPNALFRGLSVKSVIKGAGNVYGLRGEVVRRSVGMTRFFRYQESPTSRLSFSCDPIETRIFDDFLDKLKYTVAADLEKSPDLDLDALLEYLDVEEWVRSAIRAIEQGDNFSHFTDTPQRP